MKQFHPAVRNWFEAQFAGPTQTQLDAWAAISGGNNTLVAAPTGSGKTLAAFLTAVDDLIKQADCGDLKRQVQVVYVSPLKALSNDILHNLETPLKEIQENLANLTGAEGRDEMMRIHAAVRTGDTPQRQRARMVRHSPHILVTTPESLYILLTSDSGRSMLSTARTLIVDEIHALAGNKRGAHLALSMERLQGICDRPLTRIGLSATQNPIETVGYFLTGSDSPERYRIVDGGHQRERDIEICLPRSPLQAVTAGEVWNEIYGILESLINTHITTLIFVNTRRLAERLAKALSERLGEDAVTSHHGSLAKEHRFSAEQKLKTGRIKALVATASLEMGIDIGDVNLVCQIGSPRAVSIFLQRVGRSGHGLGKTPRGRLFPLSRDDLAECAALIDAIQSGELDKVTLYPSPLDVLAQQIVAEVSAGERTVDDLFRQFTKAAPYRNLTKEKFNEVIAMLAEGFSTRRGRRSAYIHLDEVNGKIKPRKSARLTAVTNGGTIPDRFDYDVILNSDGMKVGTLNEDFAFESLPGDIFQLGNTSYQILKVEPGKVFVRDACGQPPNIPFWIGEAPGRSDAVSHAVSRLRKNMEDWLREGADAAAARLHDKYNLSESAVSQLTDYMAAAYSALGALPSEEKIIFERFFDEAGDQHLVIHSTFGSRLNRAWGLSLRKRFCRKFNFELQAAALDDTIVFSLGAAHSFALDEPASYLQPETAENVLTQALLDAPMFPAHWRWNAVVALAVRRFSNGQKTPPQFQRSNAEDLIAAVFPDQMACAENLAGNREIPHHPLVEQTLYDCLHDLMDVDGFKAVLKKMRSGRIQLICRDLAAPSPLSEEVLTAKPYAFLDDAPAEERRTALARARQFLQPEDAVQLRSLDRRVIEEVRRQAWPAAMNHDECHDALMILGGISQREILRCHWEKHIDKLLSENRVHKITLDNGTEVWAAAERVHYWKSACDKLSMDPEFTVLGCRPAPDAGAALTELIRMRLQGTGPVYESELQEFFQCARDEIHRSLLALEQEGYAMRGKFQSDAEQWCERGLLARIHRRTIKNLRRQIQPASVNGFMRYLFSWQGLDEDGVSKQNGPDALFSVIKQLEGLDVAAGAWEQSVLPARLQGYMPYWLDMLCSGGQIAWMRLNHPGSQSKKAHRAGAKMNRQSPVSLLVRGNIGHWLRFSHNGIEQKRMSPLGRSIYRVLEQFGAQFFNDLAHRCRKLNSEVEDGLSELSGLGVVNSDNFSGLGVLIGTRPGHGRRFGRTGAGSRLENAGRWSLIRGDAVDDRWQSVAYIAAVLLRRYGIVFRRLLEYENHLPSWRELLYVYRRMEARGEVRGGRFVDGMAGEHFALPEAVGLLRNLEKNKRQNSISISASDPLNLTGGILPDDRVPAVGNNRLLFENGALIAALVAGEVNWLVELDAPARWRARQKLISMPAAKPGKYGQVRSSRYH